MTNETTDQGRIIDQYRLGNLEAFVRQTIVREEPGDFPISDFTLTIVRTDRHILSNDHTYMLDDLPIVERLTRWGMSIIEEIHQDFP